MYSTHSCTALNIKMHNHITAMACISARLFLGICASRGVTPSTRGGAAGHSTKLLSSVLSTKIHHSDICRITVHTVRITFRFQVLFDAHIDQQGYYVHRLQQRFSVESNCGFLPYLIFPNLAGASLIDHSIDTVCWF